MRKATLETSDVEGQPLKQHICEIKAAQQKTTKGVVHK